MPDRFCEQEYVPSLQTAVAVPQDAEIGEGTVQMFDPGGGDGGKEGGGEGAPPVAVRMMKSNCRSLESVTDWSVES